MTTVVIPGNNKASIFECSDCRSTLIALGISVNQELIAKRRSLRTKDLAINTPVPTAAILYGFLILGLPNNNRQAISKASN